MLNRLVLAAAAAIAQTALVAAAPLVLEVDRAVIIPDTVSGFVQLQVELESGSARALTKFTSRHVGEVVEMWLDSKLVISPVIQTVIVDGVIMISGNFSHGELDRMADQLNADKAVIELIVP